MKRLICAFVLAASPALAASDHTAAEHGGLVFSSTRLEAGAMWREGADPVGFAGLDFKIGGDEIRLGLLADVEFGDETSGEAEGRLMFTRSEFVDWFAGAGAEFGPGKDRPFLTAGVASMLPYGFIEQETALRLDTEGVITGKIALETEWLLTQDIGLEPHLSLGFASRDGEDFGAGLTEFEAALDLVWRRWPAAMPFIGASWTRALGETSSMRRAAGEDSSEFAFKAGLILRF